MFKYADLRGKPIVIKCSGLALPVVAEVVEVEEEGLWLKADILGLRQKKNDDSWPEAWPEDLKMFLSARIESLVFIPREQISYIVS